MDTLRLFHIVGIVICLGLVTGPAFAPVASAAISWLLPRAAERS